MRSGGWWLVLVLAVLSLWTTARVVKHRAMVSPSSPAPPEASVVVVLPPSDPETPEPPVFPVAEPARTPAPTAEISTKSPESSTQSPSAAAEIKNQTLEEDFPTFAPVTPEDLQRTARRDAFLPRTWRRPYGVFGASDRLFVYNPNGGYANQVFELATSMHFARFSNRTLVLPFVGSHSSGAPAYLALGPRHLFPMDRLLDLPHIDAFFHSTPDRPALNLIPLNITVGSYGKRLMPRDQYVYVSAGTTFEQSGARAVRALSTYLKERRFVHFGGPKYYGRWFLPAVMEEARYHVRAAPAIRALAVRIVKSTFSTRRFNAIHVRLGDYTYKAETGTQWLRKIQANPQFTPETPLYIATDASEETKRVFFAPIRAVYNVTYRADLLPSNEIDEYLALFPEETRMDFFGVVEQLVCAQAFRFIPSYYSTFSSAIVFARVHLDKLLPEARVNATGEAEVVSEEGEAEPASEVRTETEE